MKITTAQMQRCSNTGSCPFSTTILILPASFPPYLLPTIYKISGFPTSAAKSNAGWYKQDKTQLEAAIQIGLKPTTEENSLISSI